jgi:hypothetical protein
MELAFGCQLVGGQLGDKGAEHSFEFHGFRLKHIVFLWRKHLQIVCEQQLVFQLASGSHGYVAEPDQLGVAIAPQPSAMLLGIEIAARRSWPVRP